MLGKSMILDSRTLASQRTRSLGNTFRPFEYKEFRVLKILFAHEGIRKSFSAPCRDKYVLEQQAPLGPVLRRPESIFTVTRGLRSFLVRDYKGVSGRIRLPLGILFGMFVKSTTFSGLGLRRRSCGLGSDL